jgi:hypothetical protein
MVGCNGCRRAKNAVVGDVVYEQVRKSGREKEREREGGKRMFSRLTVCV